MTATAGSPCLGRHLSSRVCLPPPRGGPTGVPETPEALEDWTGYAEGTDNLRCVVIPRYLTLPCGCATRETAS